MPRERPSALVKAMNFLAARGLSEAELLAKLRRAGYSDEEADSAIAECVRRNYLNDEQLTADCVDLLHQRNLGARQIRQKLLRRGLDGEEISTFLNDSQEDETEAARRAMEGKLRLLSRESDPRKKREKLFRFMAARGFAPQLIFKMMDEFSSSAEE